MGKVTSYTELTAPVSGDKFPVIDVSDTSQAATGSTKWMTGSVLHNYIAKERVYSYPGTLVTGTGTVRMYFMRTATLFNIAIMVSTAPTGTGSIVVDVNKNGTTIFNPTAKPEIAISGFTNLTNVPDVTAVSAGQYLTIDIDDVGGTIAGSDLTVVVEYHEDPAS